LTQGWHVGRVFDRFKGELVDKLIIDSSAGLDIAKMKRACGVDLMRVEGDAPDEVTTRFRYDFASGKPESLDFAHRYVCDLKANFGDSTPYA
jgi:hypothetical protein